MSKRHVPKTCAVCGKSFLAYRKETMCCSRSCGSKIGGTKTAARHAAKQSGEARCPVCGKQLANMSGNMTIYCSTACRDAATRRERAERLAQSNRVGGWTEWTCPWAAGAVGGTAAGADFCLGF